MSLSRALFLSLTVLIASNVHARVSNPNPNLTIAIVGDETSNLGQSGASMPGFGVRLTDARGLPLPGLIVEFLVNHPLCAPLQPCNLPPESLYGLFANGNNFIKAETDANGIARSGEYVGGTSAGSYNVVAMILCLNGGGNCDAVKGLPGPIAYFDVIQSFVLLDGYMSGNWYDPLRSGHGLQLEFTDQNNTVLAIWFVYGPDGGQNWISAQGTYDVMKKTVTMPAVMLTGARFPPLFKSADVRSTSWGTLTLMFTDCDRGTLAWSSTVAGYGTGSMAINRLTSIRGTKCPG